MVEPWTTIPSALWFLNHLLHPFDNLFPEPQQLPPLHTITHHIHLLPNSKPVNVKPYRYPYSQKNELERQLATMLDVGMIRPSHSLFSSHVLLVKKKDGSWHCCVDYRALNVITIKDRFLMSTIDELLNELGRASWFSKLDLRQGFHQIRMNKDDIQKTVFRTHHGHYEFKVMPFRLCNTPSIFQVTMNDLLLPFLWKFVVVFFVDILVYIHSFPSHLELLETVFSSLSQGAFFLRRSKCIFAKQKLSYLGHIVSPLGAALDLYKYRLWLIGQPRHHPRIWEVSWASWDSTEKFIRKYATIAASLTALLRKENFSWNPDAQEAFQQLKTMMTQAPVLTTPDFTIPFTFETDALGTTMEAVLLQNSHPIAFFSKQLCPGLQ